RPVGPLPAGAAAGRMELPGGDAQALNGERNPAIPAKNGSHFLADVVYYLYILSVCASEKKIREGTV
ncbi:MAG: hypothetical protein LUG55_02520, partial [Clostridiales bacterium]|nr:hypothetical protein [Clostridiales bacterium]